MAAKKFKPSPGVSINAYAVISAAVSTGVAIGIRRAHKHDNHPSEDLLAERIEDSAGLST